MFLQTTRYHPCKTDPFQSPTKTTWLGYQQDGWRVWRLQWYPLPSKTTTRGWLAAEKWFFFCYFAKLVMPNPA
jgi:hypothetical protein